MGTRHFAVPVAIRWIGSRAQISAQTEQNSTTLINELPAGDMNTGPGESGDVGGSQAEGHAINTSAIQYGRSELIC